MRNFQTLVFFQEKVERYKLPVEKGTIKPKRKQDNKKKKKKTKTRRTKTSILPHLTNENIF